MKPALLYFCSNGLGENLQASPAMRRLKRDYYVIMVCRRPIHVTIHPDCYHEIIAFDSNFPTKTVDHIVARLAAANSSRTTDLVPTPWTAHLDPKEEIRDALVARGLIFEKNERKGPGYPCSATRCFWHKTVGAPLPNGAAAVERCKEWHKHMKKEWTGENPACPNSKELLMSAADPDTKREGDYDIIVSSGSAEKCRRLPELQQVMLCNQLMAAGYRVCLQTAANRPDNLHPRAGVAINRWNEGTMEQLKELVWSARMVIGPDSGTNHLALAYGKHLIFLESREACRYVVDDVYDVQCSAIVMAKPDCLANCSARRIPLDAWPAAGTRSAEPGYPHNLECFNLPEVPCLKFDAGTIASIVDTAKIMLK